MGIVAFAGFGLGQAGGDELEGGRLLGDDRLELGEIDRTDVELAGVEHGEDLARDILGMGEGQLLDAFEVDAIDDLLAEVAPQVIVALATNAHDLDGLAVPGQALDVGSREARDAGVEAAAQAALGGHDNEQMHLILAGADQQWGGALPAGDTCIDVGQHARHALGIGTRGGGSLLRAAQLGGGHHLHGFCDLPRRLHRGDAVAHVFQ